AGDVSDLRRDRGVAGQRQGCGMTTSEIIDEHDEQEIPPPTAQLRGGFGGGRMSAGVPLERSLNFGTSTHRLLRRMGPDRARLGLVGALAVVSVTLLVSGPKILGHATDIVVAGISGGGIDFGALRRTLLLAVCVYAVSAALAYLQAYTLAGVVQRTMFRLR